MVNPLLMALRHNRVLGCDEETVALPDTMLTLLLANCDPTEPGSEGISPLCQALKFGMPEQFTVAQTQRQSQLV